MAQFNAFFIGVAVIARVVGKDADTPRTAETLAISVQVETVVTTAIEQVA